ncbi:MAG: hypothetical protein R3301_05700 [Saprospiraceae bacterium]|nr:hypothetical protein [Saprospiraceae bacterium]
MSRRIFLLCVLGWLVISAGAAQSTLLPDGVYVVKEVYRAHPGPDNDPAMVTYNYRIVDSTAQTYRYLRVERRHFVPLQLDRAPERVRQADDRSHLFLTLDGKSRKRLKRLTRKHTGGRVAIVIGGEAVTMHKIRTPITGGRLQITRCTDDACNYLFLELRDNVRK